MKDRIAVIKYKLRNQPKAVLSLVIANLLIFLICTFTGRMLYNNGCTSVRFLGDVKQWYRLISSTFLHADMEHIVNNMLILFFVGEMVEKASSTSFSYILYFSCGLAGNLMSAWYEIFSHHYSNSIGASGAVFGYLGCFISFVAYKRIRSENMSLLRIVGSVCLMLYAGLSNDSINNAAHFGGLIFGLIVGMIYCIIKEKRVKNPWR